MVSKTRLVVALSLIFFHVSHLHAEELTTSAVDETNVLIKRCGAPKFVKGSKEESCVDASFDFEAIALAALAPHQAALGPSRYAKCTQAFTQVLRARARDASSALAKATIDKTHSDSSDPFDVPLQIRDEKAQEVRQVSLTWRKVKGARLRVVDVKLEGASIVLDYRNQFARILKKNGPDALLKKLRERLPKK